MSRFLCSRRSFDEDYDSCPLFCLRHRGVWTNFSEQRSPPDGIFQSCGARLTTGNGAIAKRNGTIFLVSRSGPEAALGSAACGAHHPTRRHRSRRAQRARRGEKIHDRLGKLEGSSQAAAGRSPRQAHSIFKERVDSATSRRRDAPPNSSSGPRPGPLRSVCESPLQFGGGQRNG
jgi:hypothetical protein